MTKRSELSHLGDYLYAAIPTLPPNNPALHREIDPSRPASCSWHTCAALPGKVIRIDWPNVPTQQQRDEVDAALAAFTVPTPAQEARRQAATLLSRPEINALVNAILHELYPIVDKLAKKAGEPIRSEKQFKMAIAARIAAGDVSDP